MYIPKTLCSLTTCKIVSNYLLRTLIYFGKIKRMVLLEIDVFEWLTSCQQNAFKRTSLLNGGKATRT
ncbi:uncharacterized protein Gasu_23620 [Galdieria sulphuraria]|uniref:Uncharacterized protein n=1 Tax=Galdieria sulphuraria TaxID=130081 RepID=M2X1G5_GALSU|nr:uncharacterized protein Gasu_23620 [Galdieria sulphuraria]EME30205.1 hypothetical protein Gasu_23620 [Galdieria sulphuraria]|eukprot:XP_005706725.1 hypothetical protein Gasu_23620 [Galdieria sulphuraria]